MSQWLNSSTSATDYGPGTVGVLYNTDGSSIAGASSVSGNSISDTNSAGNNNKEYSNGLSSDDLLSYISIANQYAEDQRAYELADMEYNSAEAQKDRDFNAQQAEITRNYNAEQAQLTREYNSVEAQKERDWQTQMSNTAHQREVQDLIAAGLNPVLSAKYGSGASSGSGASASSGAASSSSASSSSRASHTSSAGNVASQLFSNLINSAVSYSIAHMNNETSQKNAVTAANASQNVANTYTNMEYKIKEEFPEDIQGALLHDWEKLLSNSGTRELVKNLSEDTALDLLGIAFGIDNVSDMNTFKNNPNKILNEKYYSDSASSSFFANLIAEVINDGYYDAKGAMSVAKDWYLNLSNDQKNWNSNKLKVSLQKYLSNKGYHQG